MAGHAWAISETWYRFSPMVNLLAQRALGSLSEAEDIAQEVFCRVFRKVSTLQEPDSLRPFIYGFAIRVLKTELRRKRLSGWLRFDKPDAVVGLDSRGADFESRDLLRRLEALLNRLSSRERLVFVLRRMESMTVDEISAHMEVSESTVKRSMSRVSRRLSRWIDADPGLADLLDAARWVP
jgi:RNA polymerase sigma-70 factor (ECF subfamily)